jgi:hypothetical protein
MPQDGDVGLDDMKQRASRGSPGTPKVPQFDDRPMRSPGFDARIMTVPFENGFRKGSTRANP